MGAMRNLPSLMLLCAALFLGGLPTTLLADEAERAERERELEEVRERIEEVRSALAADRERRDDVSAALEAIEREIGELAGRIQRLDRRIGEHRARLAELDEERAAAEDRLAEHRETLEAQVRAAYRLGREPALRLLLRQDEPDAVARAMGYYGYFNAARLDAMTATTEALATLEDLRAETTATQEALARDRAGLDSERERLAAARVERQEILARLERDIDSRGERLERLEADRERLEDLLERLGSMIADIPDSPLDAAPFVERSGQLDWPVAGRVRTSFGSARAGGRLRWQGIVIAGEAGEPVRAVYHGRVVFADWLSGFGQLVIIDHQDGFMSLYGFNEQVLRAEGEWVVPGEPVATIGSSGAQDEPGLYFEIRRRGEPRDPIGWLASR